MPTKIQRPPPDFDIASTNFQQTLCLYPVASGGGWQIRAHFRRHLPDF
jgi:hypothetical protein